VTAPVSAAANVPMAMIGRPGTAMPAASRPARSAPRPPPVTAPAPAPCAALVPSSVRAESLPRSRLRVFSDITRLTSFLP
jgi:hypothetical protein